MLLCNKTNLWYIPHICHISYRNFKVIIVLTKIMDTVHHLWPKIPQAGFASICRWTYSTGPVTHSWVQLPHTEQNLDNVYKLVISQIISERWDIWSIKANVKIPLKTSDSTCHSNKSIKAIKLSHKIQMLTYKWDSNLRLGGIGCGCTIWLMKISEFYEFMRNLM